MGTTIPSLGEYYFKNGKYVLKSKFARGVKIGMMVGFLIGGVFATDESSSHIQNAIYDVSLEKTLDQKIVEYVKAKNKNVTDSDAYQIASSTIKWASEFDIDLKLVLAVQEVESTFNKFSISNAGALGVMQVIPSWHLDKMKTAIKDVGTPELFDINTNIYLGTWVLKSCLGQYKNVSSATLCYNGSNAKPNGYDIKVKNKYVEIGKYMKGVT